MIATFCGHSRISQSAEVEKRLYTVTQRLIEQGITTFYLGGYGAFDSLAASVLRKQKKRYPQIELVLDAVDKSVVLWYNEEKRTGVFLHGEQLSTARYVRCDVGNSQAVHNRKQGNVGRERKGYPSISEWRVLDFENGSTMERPAAGIW